MTKGTIENAEEFFNLIPQILKKKELILNNPKYYFMHYENAYSSTAFIKLRAGGFIYLGDLIKAWSAGRLIRTCPVCAEKTYIYHFFGSPLSGRGGGTGFCVGCNTAHTIRTGLTSFLGEFMKEGLVLKPDEDFEVATWEELLGIIK